MKGILAIHRSHGLGSKGETVGIGDQVEMGRPNDVADPDVGDHISSWGHTRSQFDASAGRISKVAAIQV
jgi:hypothetical protein